MTVVQTGGCLIPWTTRRDGPEVINAYAAGIAAAVKEHYAQQGYSYGVGLSQTLRQDLRDLTVPEVVHLANVSQRLVQSPVVPSAFLREIIAVEAENRIAAGRGWLGQLAVSFLRLVDR